MSCPRCREDGTQYDLDCGCTVCEDCHTAQEIMEGVCCRCRAEMAKAKNPKPNPEPCDPPMVFLVRCYDVEAGRKLLALACELGLARMVFLDECLMLQPDEKEEANAEPATC